MFFFSARAKRCKSKKSTGMENKRIVIKDAQSMNFPIMTPKTAIAIAPRRYIIGKDWG